MEKNKRKHYRKPVERKAWIEVGETGPVIECSIGNLSETGAQLIFTSVAVLPKEFVLRLSQDGRVARKCRLAWKSDNKIGVSFIARLAHVAAERAN